MSLRSRRVLHFASLAAVFLGLSCGGSTVWLVTAVLGDQGSPLLVEGLLASTYLLAFGLLLKLRGLLAEIGNESSDPGSLHDHLSKEMNKPSAGAKAFNGTGSFLALVSLLMFVALVVIRTGNAPKGLLEKAGIVASLPPTQFSMLGLFLCIALLLVALHLLLSALGLIHRRGRKHGSAGLITQITAAPSLPPELRL